MKTYKESSSTRVDFSGGTLDLWPLYTLIPESLTINASINCYTSAEFTPGSSLKITVESPDFKENFEFSSFEEFDSCVESKLSLLQKASVVLKDKKDFIGEWILKSESPAGSGLGGSSSLLISVLKVMFKIKNEQISDLKMIETARDIESSVLKTPAGIQDYFSPLAQGLNVISYTPLGVQLEKMNDVASFWKERILILDSEIKHHSGFNNWQILKGFVEGEKEVVSSLNELAKISHKAFKALKEKDVSLLAQCFNEELEARRKVSKEYISEELDKFLSRLMNLEEVVSFKVCGAGGGGCLILLFEPSQKIALESKLKEGHFKVFPFEMNI